jgi:hypothetical protein
MIRWFRKMKADRNPGLTASDSKRRSASRSARATGRDMKPSQPGSQHHPPKTDWEAERDWITRYGDPFDD